MRRPATACLVLMAALAAPAAWAQATEVDAQTLELVKQSQRMAEEARERHAETYAGFQRQAEEVTEAFIAEQAEGMVLPDQAREQARSELPVDGRGYRIFLSQSMPESELEAAALLAARDPRVVLVFRGMKPGQHLLELSQLMQRLMRLTEDGPVARVEIDPPAFQAAGVTRVPTLVAYHDGEAVATARGVFRPQWIDERTEQGRTGDLGVHGSTYPIIEEDLLTVFQQRIAAVAERFDAQVAIRGFYDGLSFQALPPARVARERRIDPTVVVQQDLIAPDGTVIALRGARVNPLDTVPFPGQLIVFDGTQPAQRALALRERDAAPGQVTLITSRLREDDRGAGLEELHAAFEQRVFLLDERIVQRFRLERLPSIVEADATHYIVRELPAQRTGESTAME